MEIGALGCCLPKFDQFGERFLFGMSINGKINPFPTLQRGKRNIPLSTFYFKREKTGTQRAQRKRLRTQRVLLCVFCNTRLKKTAKAKDTKNEQFVFSQPV